MNRKQLGDKAEQQAVDYLKTQAYLIVGTKLRFGRSEVDIVARKDDLIIFIEVKYRSSRRFGNALQSVDVKKQQMLAAAASAFLEEHTDASEIRFDLILIEYEGSKHKLSHIKDAFLADDYLDA